MLQSYRVIRIILHLSILLLAGCFRSPSIPIGFSGELTGRRAEMGVDARDAAILAVDEINARSGIHGRQIQLLIQDDKGIPEMAREVDSEHIRQGVVAIIGHVTSEQTAAALPLINQAKVILISPTACSSDISNQDDYFFRVVPDTNYLGKSLAEYIHEQYNFPFVASVYDQSNVTYTLSMLREFSKRYHELGGMTDPPFSFQSEDSDLHAVAVQVLATHPPAVLIAASAVDSALLAQYLRQQGFQGHLFGTVWAQTDQLIEKGGQAVQGMELSTYDNLQDTRLSYLDFVNKFKKRYNRSPSLGASHAYEAVQILENALQKTDGSAQGLREALLTIKDFPSIQGSITFNPFGEVARETYIVKIEGNMFTTIKVILPP